MVVCQALDLAGHVINGRKLRRAEGRLDAAEERGKRIEAALAVATTPGGDSERMSEVRAGREAKADAAAQMEVAVLAHLTETLGETLGPAVLEWTRTNAPDAWKRARANPKSAMVILGPAVALAERLVASQKTKDDDSPRRSLSGFGV